MLDISNVSISLNCFTLLDVPSSPTAVRLANIKSRSLEISWLGPHDGNSPILNYVIEYSNLPGMTQCGA